MILFCYDFMILEEVGGLVYLVIDLAALQCLYLFFNISCIRTIQVYVYAFMLMLECICKLLTIIKYYNCKIRCARMCMHFEFSVNSISIYV